MARFVNHTSCPKCGSSDARALYDDGSSFCFSCRTSANRGYVRNDTRRRQTTNVLPDCVRVISGAGWDWVSKYGLSAEQLLKNNVLYSPSRNQVIFTFPEYPEFWTTRNLWPDAKPKAFHNGKVNEILPIYSQSEADAIVLAEDCLSAIKISYVGCDSMPLLGSSLSSSKLSRIAKTYRNLVVWLDHDKGSEAHKIARRASLLGMQARVIHTELDPKDYRYGQIREYLS
jgi:hypothetical protein